MSNATDKNNDWIVIGDSNKGAGSWFKQIYEVSPNTRCQFFISSSLSEYPNHMNSTIRMLQDTLSFNITSNQSITNTSLIRSLKMYQMKNYKTELKASNISSQLWPMVANSNYTIESGAMSYFVVINDSPDQRLTFSVLYSNGRQLLFVAFITPIIVLIVSILLL